MPNHILGDLINPGKGIKENTNQQFFEFYVAAFSKPDYQTSHQKIYEDAEKYHETAPTMIDPFARANSKYSICLAPEPDNPHDSNAIKILARNTITREHHLLGYVPKQLCKQILKNKDYIKPGWIRKTKRIWNGTVCCTKVAIPWSDTTDISINLKQKRITRILSFDE